MYERLTDWQKNLIAKGEIANYRRRADGQAVTALRFDPVWVHRHKLPLGIAGCPAPNADNWAYEGCIFWIKEGEKPAWECKKITAAHWLVNGKDVISDPDFEKDFEKA